MSDSTLATARFVLQGDRVQEGGMWRAVARDTILGESCTLWWAPEPSPEADVLDERADRLATVDHPALAPLLHRFVDREGATIRGVVDPAAGLAVRRAAERPEGTSETTIPSARRLDAVLDLLGVLRHLHTRGLVHGHLDPTAIRWDRGRIEVTWSGARTGATPRDDLVGAKALASEWLEAPASPRAERFAEHLRSLDPDDAEDLASALRDAGLPVPPGGADPLPEETPTRVGALSDALEGMTRPLRLLGPVGSGRSALARAVLGRAASHGLPTLDLSHATRPAQALHRMILADSHPPTFDESWAEAVRAALADGWSGVVYVGPLDRMATHDRAIVAPLLPHLVRAGLQVLVASDRGEAGSIALPVGWPPGGSAGSGVLDRLASLPDGIPSRVVAALPSSWRSALPDLSRRGLVRFTIEGALHVHARPITRIDPELAAAVEPALLDPLADTDPLWLAVTWTRLGRVERARDLFDEAVGAAGERLEMLVELCRHLAVAGHPAAVLALARLHLDAGHPWRALTALASLPSDDPTAAGLRGRALARAGRPEAALAALDAGSDPDEGSWWCARCRVALAADDPADAELSLRKAAAAPRKAPRSVLLQARADLALAHLRAGQAPVDLPGLFTALQQLQPAPPPLWVTAARILLRLGEDARAIDLLGRARDAADAGGAALYAASLRLAAAEAAHRIGRTEEATASATEALVVARFVGDEVLARRTALFLARAALASGAIDEAQRYGDVLSAPAGDPALDAPGALTHARLALARGEPEIAREALARLDPAHLDPRRATEYLLARLQALLECGRVTEARQLADSAPTPTDPALARRLAALKGRVHLAVGRRYLAEAHRQLPESPRPGERQESGEILLAHAGEDLDPDRIARRVRDLERAAQLLSGPARQRAERLHRRLSDPTEPEETRALAALPAEPREVLGLIATDDHDIDAIETTLALLDPSSNNNLLLTGPTGAGKRVFAERVAREHLGLQGLEEVVLRRTDPQMLVSQLVGTRRGEFTGALDQTGAIQRALSGRRALLLDELHTLDRVGQEILLPLLELPQRRFGGLLRSSEELPGPLQIILATNVDVSGFRWRERFRSDLWFRMSQLHVHLPALADRGTEAIFRYLTRMLAEEGFTDAEQVLEPRALYALLGHPWEGNLRELHTVARRLARLRRHLGRRLEPGDLPRLAIGDPSAGSTPVPERDVLETLELNTVVEALRRAEWSQALAARRLGISKYRLHRILQKHDLIDWVREHREGSAHDGS